MIVIRGTGNDEERVSLVARSARRRRFSRFLTRLVRLRDRTREARSTRRVYGGIFIVDVPGIQYERMHGGRVLMSPSHVIAWRVHRFVPRFVAMKLIARWREVFT